nr:hypothetical protein CoNPh38_CDS0291 [Staphylococcus phage S-CoN_Ph38]
MFYHNNWGGLSVCLIYKKTTLQNRVVCYILLDNFLIL